MSHPWSVRFLEPIVSIYGIFTYIYHKYQLNVGEYTIHEWYGEDNCWSKLPNGLLIVQAVKPQTTDHGVEKRPATQPTCDVLSNAAWLMGIYTSSVSTSGYNNLPYIHVKNRVLVTAVFWIKFPVKKRSHWKKTT